MPLHASINMGVNRAFGWFVNQMCQIARTEVEGKCPPGFQRFPLSISLATTVHAQNTAHRLFNFYKFVVVLARETLCLIRSEPYARRI
jgi:hypothetical protein